MTSHQKANGWAGVTLFVCALSILLGSAATHAQGTQPDFPPFGLDVPWTLVDGSALVQPGDGIDKATSPREKWYLMRVGRIWQGEVRARWSSGFNGGYSWPGGQTQGMSWADPSDLREHWGSYQKVTGGITGARNWTAKLPNSPTDPTPTTVTYPYFSAENVRFGWDLETKFTEPLTHAQGPNQPNSVTGYTGLESAMVMRWMPPQVIVNGVRLFDYADSYGSPGSGPVGNGVGNFLQQRGVVDPNLRSEQVLFHGWRTPQGVDIFRKIHQYGAYPDNNYFLQDMYFVNTGNVDPSPAVERPNATVEDFRVILAHQVYSAHLTEFMNNPPRDDDKVEYINPWPTYVDNQGAYRQVVISYDGDGSYIPGPDWGDPYGIVQGGKQVTGNNLWARGYFGYTFVFAETLPGSGIDDPAEPRANTLYAENQLRIERDFLAWDHGKQFRLAWTGKDDPSDLASARRHYNPAAPSVGTDIVENQPYTGINGMTIHTGADAGDLPSYYDATGAKTGQGVYHAVFGIAAAGLDDQEARKIATRVITRDAAGVNPADRMTQAEIDLVKSGRDSLMQALDRMFWNVHGFDPNGSIMNKPAAYDQAFNVPDPPRPPGCFWVTSENRRIELAWTGESNGPNFDTGVNDLAGYRIYRALGSPDSTWRVIAELPATATSYTDNDVIADFTYFYAITAFNDGTQNWADPGTSLESGMFWNWTGWGYYPNVDPGPGAARPSEFGRPTTDDILVVPNPYNTNLQFPEGFIGAVDKIFFKNLPAPCTIRIYTTAGVLVKTIENELPATDPLAASVGWNMANDYNQLVASGVYIFTVESTVGNHVGKFIIIR